MKIAIIADVPNMNTGYGRIAKYLGYELAGDNEVSYIGLQHRGNPVTFRNKDRDMYVYSGAVGAAGNQQTFDRSMRMIDPDITIMTRDPVTFAPNRFPQAFTLKHYKGEVERLSWIPAMSNYTPSDIIRPLLESSDLIQTYTEAARLTYMDHGVPYNIMRTINVGYDDTVYNTDGPKDYFDTEGDVFTFVGLMFDTRKRIGLLLKAFREYLYRYDHDATMYIHNMPVGTAYDVNGLANMLGIRGHLIFPAEWHHEWGVPDEEMAHIFRSSRAVVSFSPQEGFNMPFLEAMACGTPVVGNSMPFYDWSDQILQVPSIEADEGSMSFGYLSDPVKFAEYMDTTKDVSINTDALKHLTWPNIGDQFREVIK